MTFYKIENIVYKPKWGVFIFPPSCLTMFNRCPYWVPPFLDLLFLWEQRFREEVGQLRSARIEVADNFLTPLGRLHQCPFVVLDDVPELLRGKGEECAL